MLLLVLFLTPALNLAKEPVADMHIHYKWSQRDVTSVSDTGKILKKEEIALAVVIGTPAELAVELQQAMPDKVVAIFSPYHSNADWFHWAYDKRVVKRARDALESGDYHGIGELHLIGGFAPDSKQSGVLQALMSLAAEFDVPIMLHTEYSNADVMLSLCRSYGKTKILWAHAGAILEPRMVDDVMQRCDNVWAGLGARDPWRFVNNPITGDDGRLLPEWRNLLLKYSDRFMVGSDPVWPVEQMTRWDEADTGWQKMGDFWNFHRSWLAQLPVKERRKIALENAHKLFSRAVKSSGD